MCPDKAFPSLEECLARSAAIERSYGVSLDVQFLLSTGSYGRVMMRSVLTAWRATDGDQPRWMYEPVVVRAEMDAFRLNPWNSSFLAALSELDRVLEKHVWRQIKLPL